MMMTNLITTIYLMNSILQPIFHTLFATNHSPPQKEKEKKEHIHYLNDKLIFVKNKY